MNIQPLLNFTLLVGIITPIADLLTAACPEYNIPSLPLCGSGKQQFGHSPRWLISVGLNNLSSRNSANRFLHFPACSGLCNSRHPSLQYFTRSQPPSHDFNFISSLSAMPQLAHTS